MDYEKSYKEALEQAKFYYGNCPSESEKKKLKKMFPVLRESEDERIRKEIIDWMKGGTTYDWQENKEKWIAYLERQKEQQPAEWSEEDKENLYNIIEAIKYVYDVSEDSKGSRLIIWLKSLRPQPKQEWSDENEEHLNSIIESYKVLLKDYKAWHDVDYIPYSSNTVIRNVVDDINFLKSLRHQPHWKPSEEQMGTLKQWLQDHELDGNSRYVYPIFYSLLSDLQKLL